MTTIILIFFIAFLSSLLLTPIVSRIAKRFNIVDVPKDRKVHDNPVPRLGGVALFLSFFAALSFFVMNKYMYLAVVAQDPRLPLFLIALTATFLLGFWDDIRRLSSGFKFFGQLFIGVFSYYAGIKISVISFPFIGALHLGYFALPITVFWFVLVINAINLIDGLDGLAAGITLFVSITMMVICLYDGRLLEATAFAALGGSLIGFLNYNFYPASIFMGDGGSYFIGYLIAALSIMGSIKNQVATAMIIPLIALGIPMIDTLVAPIRRFILGRDMFQPDKSHLHHQLLKLGLTQRRAVLIIYGATILLGMISISMVHAQDEVAALVLIILGLGVIFLGRYCWARGLININGIGIWLKDVSYETGISRERRVFLDHQRAIARATDIDQFWEEVCKALHYLEFDLAELALFEGPGSSSAGSQTEREIKGLEPYLHFTWNRNGAKAEDLLAETGLLKIEQPLMRSDSKLQCYGTLFLVKDIREGGIGHYSLKRLEHLRRAMGAKLESFSQQKLQ
jgi:UDP-GlcNAc:undecaprenyl-phosphate GlcNAc-1-phosphate transferase